MKRAGAGRRVVVVGAGVVGMCTAVQIQAAAPDCSVTVLADRFGSATTSDGAAGMFRPSLAKTPGTDEQLLRKWLRTSWDYFDRVAHSSEAAEAGVQIVAGYQFFNDDKKDIIEKSFIYDHRNCTEKELAMFPGPKYRNGVRTTTIMAECRRFLPYLMKKFRLNGGHVEQRTLNSLRELSGNYDVAVICTGYASKKLLGDPHVYCSRGHLIRVRAPWIKQFIYAEDGRGNCSYVYPGIDTVVVGGTRQRGDEDVQPRKHEHQAIWDRACEMVPSLKSANILWDWVGLRPYREPLRLHKDTLHFDNGNLPVVYNYGHGGDGVSLGWGTAVDATKLVIEHLDTSLNSKL